MGRSSDIVTGIYVYEKVCVVSNVIGNRDVIHTGENGFVCSGTDEYVHAIRNVKNNGTNVITESAYHDITCLYNTKKMAEQYEKIYEDNVKEKN